MTWAQRSRRDDDLANPVQNTQTSARAGKGATTAAIQRQSADGFDPAAPSEDGRAPIQRKEDAAPQPAAGQDDPFQVDRGQLTFDAEGHEGGRYHSRVAHWPGGASGVTIGRGYDLGQHSSDTILEDMATAGVSSGDASKFAAAAGKTGTSARNWLNENRSDLPEISPQQQEALFDIVYARLAGDVERISGNYARIVGERTGTDSAELEVDWNSVHPAIRDTLVDLRYRGDYTPTTRKRVQQPAIDNDLQAMFDAINDRAYWVDGRGVPEDRFNRRVAFLREALGNGQTEPTGGQTDGQTTEPTGEADGQGNDQDGQQTQDGGGQAQVPQTGGTPSDYTVTASSLNVRSSPEVTSENRIGAVSQGDVVSGVDLGNGWVRIEFNRGQGYVSAQFVSVVAAPVPASVAYTVTATRLNVRSTPEVQSGNKLGTLNQGDAVTGADLGNGWVRLEFEGQEAYASSDFLEVGAATRQEPAGDQASGQADGQAAGQASGQAGTDQAGNQEPATDGEKMEGGGESANTTGTNTDAQAGKPFTVTASALNVRSSAEVVDGNKIGMVRQGDVVTGVDAGDGWVRIDYNGQAGYVSAQHLVAGEQQQGGAQTSGNGELSGARWVQIANANGWVNNTSFSSLDSSWGPKAEAFVTALRDAGATVTITAGLRHAKRAFLMHYAWGVSRGTYTASQANTACAGQGIDINWDHGSASASRAAAQALVSAFGLVRGASITSNHIRGKAVDMKISNLPSSITVGGQRYSTRAGASNQTAAESVAPIGRAMGVIWFGSGDWVHWSHTGR